MNKLWIDQDTSNSYLTIPGLLSLQLSLEVYPTLLSS